MGVKAKPQPLFKVNASSNAVASLIYSWECVTNLQHMHSGKIQPIDNPVHSKSNKGPVKVQS